MLRRHPPRQLGGPLTPELISAVTRPSDEEGTHVRAAGPAAAVGEADEDPRAERRSERVVASLFLLSAAGTIGFCAIWFFTSVSGSNLSHLQHVNFLMGLALTAALGGAGGGFLVWGKRLLPHVEAVQERELHHSPEAEQLATEEVFLRGARSTGLPRRKLLRRTAGLALGLLPLSALFAMRDLGVRPLDQLRHTTWRPGARLVDIVSRRPLRLGDLAIGGLATVMPEGFTTANDAALSPTLLIRLRPGENQPPPGRADWAAYDHVAYSKICTHAGCPVGLYEQQTHHLLCPCHQSTFLVTEACKVLFGPAARPLPQLPIYVDAAGYFRARSDYLEPVGPSFWERG